MFRIRTKTQMTIVGMTIITLVLILFRISASDEVSPAFEKERDHTVQTSHSLVHKLEDISEVSSMTQSPKHIAKQKESEARIMADIRGRSQDDRIGRKLMLPNEKVHIVSNVDAENNDIRWSENKLFSGDRIVHLDLKGAPPRISYFEELFPLFHKLGATGILIEYEDMFPYNGTLQDIPAYNAYTRSDIKQILHLAKINMLEVIPLIQTFGHMEFILKLEKYSYLREVSSYPQVICPSHNSTFPLITAMIDQIMELHPDIKNLHIGCDEVYYLGLCVRCAMAMIDNKWSRSQLFLSHVVRVAKYIRKNYPSVMPLTWDDEFRSLSTTELLEFEVPRWLEPVVWKYSPDLGTTMASEVWENYVTVFPNIWIASAFKGATGPDRYVTDISYHLDNHRAWMDIVATYGSKINFRGLMLTGWQRYDHFAILCELLPVGLPSLATNLVYVQSNNRGDFCKKRWRSIRDTWKRQNKEEKTGTGSGAQPKRKWHLAPFLDFLKHVESERTTVGNVADSEDTEEMATPFQEDVESAPNSEGPSLETGRNKKRPRTERSNFETYVEQSRKERLQLLDSIKNVQKEDDVDLFYKSLALSVKKLPDYLQSEAKLRHLQVVMELENKSRASNGVIVFPSTSQ